LPTVSVCDITQAMKDTRSVGRSPRQRHAVLLPGSLLPYRSQWQSYVDTLPANTVLILTPTRATRLQQVLDLVATELAAAGRPVSRLPAAQLGPQRGIQATLPLA
jgi:hypothetical protein